MKQKLICLCLLLAALTMLTGCMAGLEQMYCLPKRSEDALNLQSSIDSAMAGLTYSSPISGENQQMVQTADLDGDGEQEYLVFAKSSSDKPLKILIFSLERGKYILRTTLDSNGTAFDQVEYVQMDGYSGLELVVGRQVSDQVLRSVTVYSFHGGDAHTLMSANYTKFLTCDLNSNGLKELMILRPGQTDSDNGVAELYSIHDGLLERSNEASMSESADHLKRILTGKLQDGEPAVYVASTVGENAIITDVFAIVDGSFRNVSFSNESGTSVQTLRNYYVYATDIDGDGVVELPDLIHMTPMDVSRAAERQYLIRWYAMRLDGTEVDKQFTFHNYVGGWYFQLNRQWVSRVTVIQSGYAHDFYIWDNSFTKAEKMLTIFAYTGPDRENQAIENEHFVLHRTESVVYAGVLEDRAYDLGITKDDVVNGFHLIQQEWKTGETD